MESAWFWINDVVMNIFVFVISDQNFAVCVLHKVVFLAYIYYQWYSYIDNLLKIIEGK